MKPASAEPDLFADQEPPPVPCPRCGIVRKHDEDECVRQLEFLGKARAQFATLDWS